MTQDCNQQIDSRISSST